MNCLVDTHILLWSFFEPQRLSETVRALLLDEANEIYYSPVSLMEISIKFGLKKLSMKGMTPETFYEALSESFYLCKPVDPFETITSFHLPRHHKDPFDRFLVWIAIKNEFTFLTVDRTIARYTSEGLKIVV